MNDETQKMIEVICKQILSLPIEVQNEVFTSVRQTLIRERLAHIRSEKERLDSHHKEVEFAEKTLETAFMNSLNPDIKQGPVR